MKLSLFFLALFAASGTVLAFNSQSCSYSVSSSGGTHILQSGCMSESLTLLQNSSNNTLSCSAGSPSLSKVIFEAGTYNNSIVNCTFSSALIISQHGAQNNIISPFGSYALNFSDNSSNIAIGYFFTFIPRNVSGNVTNEHFAALAPYQLASANFYVLNNQKITHSEVLAEANKINYTMPRFGQYLPTNSSGSISFALEAEQVSKNGTRSFNPYWFICPDWGYDVLSYYKFNVTADMRYTPFFLQPLFEENVQLPDNSNVYWNFSVRNFSGATNITAYVSAGYQFEPPQRAMAVKDFTGNLLSYHVGAQGPGIYQFIGELQATYDKTFEQANSTTVNYGVGLNFCTYGAYPIKISGHYTMTQKTLDLLNVFFPTNQTCSTALTIESSNVSINCRGGIINSTIASILVIDSLNVTLEGCKILGNAVNAISSSLKIVNSTLSANNSSNVAFIGADSNITLINTKMYGYSSVSDLTNSTLSNITVVTPTAPQAGRSGTRLTNQAILYAASVSFTLIAIVLLVRVLLENKHYRGRKSR